MWTSICQFPHGVIENWFVAELPIIFENQDTAIEAPAGSPTQILCRTMTPVYECQWSWRQLNQSQPWNREVKKLKAFGNESNECSIKFKNILHEREGFWTCAARTSINSSFVQAKPIRLLISEGTIYSDNFNT